MSPSFSASERTVPRFSVSDFLAVGNETLSYAFSGIEIEGEVSSFKVSKDRWVFFDLKDSASTLPCFMTVYGLKTPLEDGMKIIARGTPKLTKLGRFSFTITAYQLVGEGTIKKARELLKAKLEKEGLFAPERKRPIPRDLSSLGIISSVKSAGYADFIKILGARWGGLDLKVANVGVQGLSAADEILRALDFFNESLPVDALVILRGGGSTEDLAVFDDERLVRRVAASKIPVVSGIGHEIDVSLVDLAADLRASTPSNAAELLSRDKTAELTKIRSTLGSLETYLKHYLDSALSANRSALDRLTQKLLETLAASSDSLKSKTTLLNSLNPESVLKKGYAILSGNISPGETLEIATFTNLIQAKVINVRPKR
ncbi:exodeoxyribonuclease VII large subunit [Candidatus Saccharibacteria bacterium]|nr:exodeoxyribonuclease VII large subunit [Candidatus Saccharibacteria bacterium]